MIKINTFCHIIVRGLVKDTFEKSELNKIKTEKENFER